MNDTRDYNVRIYVRKQLRESRPSSAFREVLQTQLRSPVETRPIHTYVRDGPCNFPVQRVRASSLRVRL